jgi:hypothetical protein
MGRNNSLSYDTAANMWIIYQWTCRYNTVSVFGYYAESDGQGKTDRDTRPYSRLYLGSSGSVGVIDCT